MEYFFYLMNDQNNWMDDEWMDSGSAWPMKLSYFLDHLFKVNTVVLSNRQIHTTTNLRGTTKFLICAYTKGPLWAV
jgi:hypothetical protein